MPFKFNPFSGNFDQTGSGGGGGASYIDGEVATYNDLPLDGTAALNSAWLVRSASGVWPVSRKQAGIYIRTATAGSSRDADYTYAGTMPDVFSDANFTLYDEASTTRTGQFNLGSVTAGQNRVLTWPDGNGTIARTEDFAAPPAIGSTTPAAGSFTTLNATGTTELVNGTNAAGPFRVYNTSSSANANYERGFMRWSSNVLQIGTEKLGTGSARALEFQTDGTTRLALSTGGLVQFAGTTSSFPALKRSSTSLQVRLADDSADAPLSSASLTSGDGTKTSLAYLFAADTDTGFYRRGANTLTFVASNANIFEIVSSGVRLEVNSSLQWAFNDLSGSSDLSLSRDAADTLAQRRGLNAQAFRLYNTFTSSTNFERLNVRWASNECIIDAEAGSGGGTLRGIKIGSATSSLLGFYGATPVDRPATVADPAGGGTIDAEARTAINDIIDRLQELGLIA